jgi:AcrR family transcriptional regulator
MELLDKTAAYILENGVADLSLRPLAKAIGTSARMIIYHFGSREHLIESALKQILGGIQKEFVQSQRSVLEFWEWALKPKNQPYVKLIFEVHGLAPRNPKMYGGYVRDAIASWKSILIARGYDDVRATAVIAVFDGLLMDFLATGERKRTTRALRLALRKIGGAK